MVSATPFPTTKVFSKVLHYNRSTCSTFHLYTRQRWALQKRTSIITIHHHRKRHALQIVNVVSEQGGSGGSLLSEVSMKHPRGQKWNMGTAGMVCVLHLMCGLAPFTFNWGALRVAIGLYVFTFLGITLSFHRYLSHKSFKLPKWLEYAFAYCGTHALQGPPIHWVRTHRYHHQNSDTEKDPHTPMKGFWYSYVIWIFDNERIAKMCEEENNVEDLEKQWFYRFLERSYLVHPVALALVLYSTGGVPFIVWGMGVRTVCVYHMTWLVNALCHGRGQQKWDTGDLSLNVWWLGILAFGDGWHHNHNAFEYSTRLGLEWWQIDMTWYVIRLLQIIGLATHIKLPTPTHMQTKALRSNHVIQAIN